MIKLSSKCQRTSTHPHWRGGLGNGSFTEEVVLKNEQVKVGNGASGRKRSMSTGREASKWFRCLGIYGI